MLTNDVKEYIEQNHELLDTDEGIQQLVDNYINRFDAQDLFEVLRSAGLLQDYESLCDNYVQEIKKHTASSATGIDLEPVLKPFREGQSFPLHVEMSINNSTSTLIEIPINQGNKLIVDGTIMFIKTPDDISAKVYVGYRGVTSVLSLKELSSRDNLQDALERADKFVGKFDKSAATCIDSFQYRKKAKNFIDNLLSKLEELMQSVLGYSKIRVEDDGYTKFRVEAKSKTGTLIKLFDIDYDKPINIDENSLMSQAKTYLDSYKIQYDKNQARKAAKQAALAANPNIKIITRKEVTQAINASGVNVRTDFVYTNKHKTITTYKYAFNNLTQDECNKIKDELVKIGANVKDVTCEQGWWSGRGAYMSLFIRLYN